MNKNNLKINKIMSEKIIIEVYSKNNESTNKLNKFMEIISKAYKTLVFYKVFIETEKDMIKKFGIKNTPTILYFKNSIEQKRIEGVQYKNIINILDNAESE